MRKTNVKKNNRKNKMHKILTALITLSLALVPALAAVSLSACDFINNEYEIKERKKYNSNSNEFKQEYKRCIDNINNQVLTNRNYVLKHDLDKYSFNGNVVSVDLLWSKNPQHLQIFYVYEDGKWYQLKEDPTHYIFGELYDGYKFEKTELDEGEVKVVDGLSRFLTEVDLENGALLVPSLDQRVFSTDSGTLTVTQSEEGAISGIEYRAEGLYGTMSDLGKVPEPTNFPDDEHIIDYTKIIEVEKFQNDFAEIMDKIAQGNYTARYTDYSVNNIEIFCNDYKKLVWLLKSGDSYGSVVYFKKDEDGEFEQQYRCGAYTDYYNYTVEKQDIYNCTKPETICEKIKDLKFSADKYDRAMNQYAATGSDGVEYSVRIKDGVLDIAYLGKYGRETIVYNGLGTSKVYMPGYRDRLYNDKEYVEPENPDYPLGWAEADGEPIPYLEEYINKKLEQAAAATQSVALPQESEERKRVSGLKSKN